MLPQAAGHVAYLMPTCMTENFRHARHGHCFNGSSKWSKKHRHGRDALCYLSSDGHFAHQYQNQFTFLCKTQVHRHVLSRPMEAHRIPAGLQQARKYSIRKAFTVVAVKNSSDEGTFQHGEASGNGPSTVYKTATVSTKSVKLEGRDNKAAIVNGNTNLDGVQLPNTHTASSAIADSETRKPIKQLTGGIEDLKNWWKAIHKVYHEDTAIWGYGSSPIFTVYEGADRKIEKVLIDEKEIRRRQGVEPLLPGFADDESKARAEQKIMLAQSIAKDIEMGKIDIDSHSTIFSVIKHPSNSKNQIGREKLLSQIDIAVQKAAPILRSVFMIAIPLYGICILLGAYLLVTKRSEEDILQEEKSAANLEKMRKLKAQMSARKRGAEAGQVTLAPSDFMQKLLEVREMARQVRSEEGLQKLVKDSDTVVEEDTDTDVEEYQPQEESLPNTPILMVGNAVGMEQGGVGHEDVIDTTVSERSVPTMDTIGTTKSINNVTDITLKPPPKVKPRIITSLDEAMVILGSKETLLPNGANSSLDLNGTAERALIDRGSQAELESGVPSNGSLSATSNGLDNSQSYVADIIPSKVDQILSTSIRGQYRKEGTESIKSCETEAPQYLMSDRVNNTGTMDSLASEGRAIEAPASDSKVEASSDDSQNSDKSDSLHRLGENSEDVQVNEIQISSSARPNEVNNPAQKSKNTLFASSKTFLKNYSASKSILDVDTDEVVGSGQPLRRREARTTNSGPMSNTKRWSKELQRKYDLERDPETRELMKEIGSELDSWITEEEVEEVSKLASKLKEGDDDAARKHYENLPKKIRQEKEKFGLEVVLEKYKEYQPKPEDELWWLDLRCVLCLMVVSTEEAGGGLYGLDMTIDSEGTSNQVAKHVIAFEDRKDASNFCRLLELRSGSRFRFAEVCPFSPKKLYKVSKEEGFKVTVLKTGQIQTNIDQSLEEVEEQIAEIGRSGYWEKMERDRSIDIDSILHQRFGL